MVIDVRQDLRRALADVDEALSRQVANPATRIEEIPTSYLTRYRIVRVEYFTTSGPAVYHLAYVPGGRAVVLTGRPEAYLRICQADRVSIATRAAAIEHAGVYLSATQTASEPFYVVYAVDELRLRLALRPGEVRARSADLAKFRSLVQPPSVQAEGFGFAVVLYAVRGRRVERHRLGVEKNGGISDEVTLVYQDHAAALSA